MDERGIPFFSDVIYITEVAPCQTIIRGFTTFFMNKRGRDASFTLSNGGARGSRARFRKECDSLLAPVGYEWRRGVDIHLLSYSMRKESIGEMCCAKEDAFRMVERNAMWKKDKKKSKKKCCGKYKKGKRCKHCPDKG